MKQNFPLLDLSDNLFELKDLLSSEKINLLVFYNTNCLGCTGRALPYAYELEQKHDFINLLVIHVSLGLKKESVEEIEEVFTEKHAPFPIYRDVENKLYHTLNCEGTPHWIFLDKKGEVLHSIFGSQEGSKLKIEFAIDEMNTKFS